MLQLYTVIRIDYKFRYDQHIHLCVWNRTDWRVIQWYCRNSPVDKANNCLVVDTGLVRTGVRISVVSFGFVNPS